MDINQRQGTYPPPPGASHILGVEVSGTVEAIGEKGMAVIRCKYKSCLLFNCFISISI